MFIQQYQHQGLSTAAAACATVAVLLYMVGGWVGGSVRGGWMWVCWNTCPGHGIWSAGAAPYHAVKWLSQFDESKFGTKNGTTDFIENVSGFVEQRGHSFSLPKRCELTSRSRNDQEYAESYVSGGNRPLPQRRS